MAWIILSLFLVKPGTAIPQSEQPESDLTVMLRNSLGAKPKGKLTVRSATGRTVYSGDTEDKVTIRVPYGEYTTTFKAEMFVRVTRQIVVDRPEVLAVLGVTPESVILDAPYGPVSVTLSVTPFRSCSNGGLWARMTGVYSEFLTDQLIKPAGETGVALFEPVEMGRYVITVVDGDRIRAVTSVLAGKPLTAIRLVLNSCE